MSSYGTRNNTRYYEVHTLIYGKPPSFKWKVVFTIPGVHAIQTDTHSCGIMTAEMIAFHAHTGQISTAKDFCQDDVPTLRLSLAYQFCLLAAAQRNPAVSILPDSTGEIALPSDDFMDLSLEPSESLNLTPEEIATMQLSPDDIQALSLAGNLMKSRFSTISHIPIVINDE